MLTAVSPDLAGARVAPRRPGLLLAVLREHLLGVWPLGVTLGVAAARWTHRVQAPHHSRRAPLSLQMWCTHPPGSVPASPEAVPPSRNAEGTASPTSDKGANGYREAWVSSEQLMLAFHDELITAQEAQAQSSRELSELRTSSAQQIEARDSQLLALQEQLAALRAEKQAERHAHAEEQRRLEEDLAAERKTVTLQGDVTAALRRVVSGVCIY